MEIKKELKPCPFCGGKAKLKVYRNSQGEKEYFVYCTSIYPTECAVCPDTTFYISKDGAIDAWNRRADNDNL